MASTKPSISETCEQLYMKLNTFVTKVIERDVQPQIDSLNGSITNHTHDSRYYTESEVRSLINNSIKIVMTGQISLGTLAADGGNATKTGSISIPSGYSVLQVFPRTWFGCTDFSIVSISGSTVTVRGWNHSQSSHGAWVVVAAICIKNA